MEGPMNLPRLCRRLPLTVNRGETTRVDHPAAGDVPDFGAVRSEVRRIDQLRAAARPAAVVHDAVERERLAGSGAAGVEIIEAHRPLERERLRRLNEQQIRQAEQREKEETH